MEASSFSQFLAKMMCEAALGAIQAEKKRREELEASFRLEGGLKGAKVKYDRAKLEYVARVENVALDEWLNQVLIDAALERGDEVMFLALTEPMVEGW